ncbi:MAG: hypothetical protein ACOCP8_10300, partial [archaeon]
FMTDRGTSILVFPSASRDMNRDFQNPNYKVNFSKFALLNFPKQDLAQAGDDGQEDGIMNFSKYREGPRFYNFQPGSGSFPGPIPDKFSEQLIESIRNYIANADETYRTSKVNSKDDFYNLSEKETNSEMLFWKWCRKLNLIDLEPAIHNIDWDKLDDDFENSSKPNENVLDYFRKYLWKERDINFYDVKEVVGINADTAQIKVDSIMKIKNGDKFIFEGEILENNSILTGVSYKVFDVQIFDGAKETIFKVNQSGLDLQRFTIGEDGLNCYLDYNKFIQYIGEVTSQTNVETSKRNYTEITANIPHHAGQTPTILFDILDTNNYYPNLEVPILPEQIQEEINGSENLKSPIRKNPDNYPGSFYGYFDTEDKTYKTSNGDKLRKNGDYYGVLRSNNVDLDEEDYIEKLTEFNSDNIDGLSIDFETDHYLKMNLSDTNISNFNEFNSFKFNNEPPSDFEFNAILWYYDIDDGSGELYSNLYGIEFLNNPNDDFDENDPDGQLIRPYQKLVSNGQQDGLSYIYNLNISYKSDNDIVPMQYDPNTLYNNFSFDLYQNILQTNAQLQENFLNIISGFTFLNKEIENVRSLVYSQPQLETLSQRMDNMNKLLELYSSMQLVESPTTSIETDFTGDYPTVKVNIKDSEYQDLLILSSEDIRETNINSGSRLINIPIDRKLKLVIENDSKELYDEPLKILFNRDLNYLQQLEINLKSDFSNVSNEVQMDFNYINSDGEKIIENLVSFKLPTNLIDYDKNQPQQSTKAQNNYINSPIEEYSNNIDINTVQGKTLLFVNKEDLFFKVGDTIYIDNFLLKDEDDEIYYDYSGAYKVEDVDSIGNSNYYQIDLNVD